MADGREPTGRRRRGKNNVHHVIDMQFQSKDPKRKGKLSAERKQCAAADAADIGKQSGHKEDVDIVVTIRTACRPKQFRKTMVSLSDEKVVICHELGFGTMLRLRCGALNLPLCQMLVESFDVGQSCIKIHGRILKITHQDFGRVMGLRVGGRDVILEGSVDDADTVALWRKICGIEEGINIHGLRRLVIDSESNDDIFKPLCTGKDARASPWDDMPNDSAVIAISNSEAHLLSYLFSKKVNGTDGSGRDEVARYACQVVTRWDLTCLSPMNHLNAEVVNISVAYLSDSSIDTLFLPSTFSEMAKEYSASVPAQGLVPSTIKLCGLSRYSGRMKHCKKVFIPIHDDILKHWFLVVLNAMEGQCEIWDSNPDKSANKRCEDYAVASTLLLDTVFAAEMPKSPDVYPKWGSFVITHQDNNPTHQIIQDSGLFVIRNMQFYRKLWYQGFNSGDQRVRLALEIVNHPRNVVAELVWKAAKDEVPFNSVTPGVPLLSADQEGTILVGGIKFTPRRPHRFWP